MDHARRLATVPSLVERATRWIDDVGLWFRDLPDVLRLCIAGSAFPVLIPWWIAYQWRRAMFGSPVPLSGDVPSADLARNVWVSDKLGLLERKVGADQPTKS
jgi:hypothetical protein